MSKKCPQCYAELKQQDIFCPFCGGKIDQGKEKSFPSKRVSIDQPVSCPNCSVSNVKGAEFCSGCGEPLSGPSLSHSTRAQTTAQQFGSRESGRSQSYTYGNTTDSTAEQPERKWYQPPRRHRPAYHPIEWFFWSGWGIYITLRVIFRLLFFILRIVARNKRF